MSGFLLASPSSLLFDWFCRRHVLSSALLSGAGETQTFLVWVSPCVLFFLHADYDYDPYFLFLNYTQATPSPCSCFFCSFVAVARFPVRVFFSLSFWWGLSTKRCRGRSVLNRLCSPPPPPAVLGGGQAVLSHKCCFGLADRTVM